MKAMEKENRESGCPEGLIVLDKPEGITSQTAVSAVRRLFGASKAGHTGTLDPMATGVLPILLGGTTRAAEFLVDSKKHYLCHMKLGITTDTEDTTGEVLTRSDAIPDATEISRICRQFVGRIMQTPPMYSAIRVDGRRLMELARSGVTVEREAREIEIYSLDARPLSRDEWELDVVCSKGTYIRTLCADIGARAGCGGAMSALRRLESGGFDVTRAVTLDALREMSAEERTALVVGVEEIFSSLQRIRLPAFFERLASCGLEIYLKKIGSPSLSEGTLVVLTGDRGLFALGRVDAFPDGPAIRPIRQFGARSIK